jgi:hypothetical protein
MNLTHVAALTVLFGASVAPVLAAGNDPIHEKLSRAKTAYTVEVGKVRDAVLAYFDRREEAARKDGDRIVLDQVKAERQAFTDKGKLPNTIPATIERKLSFARSTLESAYTAAIREYTRAKKDDQAAALEKELRAMTGASYAPVRPKDGPEHAEYYKGHWYWVAADNATVADAVMLAKRLKMGLPVVEGKDDHSFLSKLTGGTNCVLGLQKVNGKWLRLRDGTAFDITAWGGANNFSNGPKEVFAITWGTELGDVEYDSTLRFSVVIERW